MNNNKAIVFKCEFTPGAPGSNKSPAKLEKWAEERAWYSGNQGGAYKGSSAKNIDEYMLDYSKVEKLSMSAKKEHAARALKLDPNKIPDKSEAKSIDAYMTRFSTLGAFNLCGAMTQEDVDKFDAQKRTTQSNIWHGYVSIPFETSLYTDAEKLQKLMRHSFGKFLVDAGFDKSNVALKCVVHSDKPHKHIHFVFFEKQPLYRDKYGREQYRWRGKISENAISNFRTSASAYISAEKDALYETRDATINGLRLIAPNPQDKELYVAMRKLSESLPKRGRLQYNAQNIAPYRKDIDFLVGLMLRRNPQAMDAHKRTLREIARRGKELASIKNGRGAEYVVRLTTEYKSRLGNVALGVVKVFRTRERDEKRYAQTNKQKKGAARAVNSYGAKVLKIFSRKLTRYIDYCRADFSSDLRRAEQKVAQYNVTTTESKGADEA